MAATANKPLRYPQRRIDASDDYLSIQILNYSAPGFGQITPTNLSLQTSTQQISSKSQILQTIYLPIPQGISDTSSIGWGDDSLNTAAAFGASEIAKVLGSQNLPPAIANAISDTGTAVSTGANSGVLKKALTSSIISKLVNSLGANTSPEGLLSRATGQVINPNMELLFKSVSLRSFTFSFDFAPRDADEALEIKNIIRSFKKSMSPKNSGSQNSGGAPNGTFISAPNVFQLEYKTGNQKNPFLNSFKPMALTNMSVNYTASGAYSTYEDATPVHLQMTLQFQELNPIYNEDYTDSDIGVGY